MNIRRAQAKDLDGLNRLLYQVEDVHRVGRPDLFKLHEKKYTDEELLELVKDDSRPIFVAVDDSEYVMGYAFCIFEDHRPDHCMTDITALYIDDLCVDEKYRGKHLGEALFEHVKREAKRLGCYEVTLCVWNGNDTAERFYEKMGMTTKERMMEIILDERTL